MNPVAIPGVDGRWQEELVKGECHSLPAPLHHHGADIHPFSYREQLRW